MSKSNKFDLRAEKPAFERIGRVKGGARKATHYDEVSFPGPEIAHVPPERAEGNPQRQQEPPAQPRTDSYNAAAGKVLRSQGSRVSVKNPAIKKPTKKDKFGFEIE